MAGMKKRTLVLRDGYSLFADVIHSRIFLAVPAKTRIILT